MEAKYIMIDRRKPVVFSPAIEHKDEANGRKVTSAGFCRIELTGAGIVVTCWGESNSLGGLQSKPEIDARMIKMMLEG